ncbi:MAG: acylphosphatase [Patescibacteria group bacterium]
MPEQRRRLTVYGQVQGVDLRWQIKKQAELLQLVGWVKNEMARDCLSVEIEGEQRQVDNFIDWLKTSPGLSIVKSVTAAAQSLRYDKNFKIRYSNSWFL